MDNIPTFFLVYILLAVVLVPAPAKTATNTSFLIINDATFLKDTHIIADTLPPSPEQRTEEFYDSLEEKANRNRVARELYKIIIKAPKQEKTDSIEAQASYIKYESYKGFKIRNIDFIQLNPFGTSIDDTSYYHQSWINNAGNTLHINTLKKVLMSNLLIKEGEYLVPEIIADNERIIRNLSYINDVRVIIITDPTDPGYADIYFVTRDVWSKGFFPELKDVNAGKLEIWDKNIFGTGNEFQNNIHWNPDKSSFWGYEASLKNKNIMGSFIDLETYYQNVFEKESYGFQIKRNFFSPETKYAGGLLIYKMKTDKRIWLSDSLQPIRSLDYNYTDLWLGRSFPIKKRSDTHHTRMNLIIASRFLKHHYFKRPPEVESRLLHDYHNKSLWLNSISVSAQSFYRSNLIYSYGRTEDVPSGWLGNLTLGKEFSEFDNRLYSSASLSLGDFIVDIGYLYIRTSLGGFLNNENSFEQGVFKLDLDYFTKMFVLNRFNYRFFVFSNYTKGLNRFPLEKINLNNENGIRGLDESIIYGEQKITVNFESVIFTPYKLYGFSFVFFNFADIGLIGNEDISVHQLNSYAGIGVGLRIRNERLVFPTLQLRFTFYPGVENLLFHDYIRFSGEKILNPKNFTPSAPAIMDYY